jgi:hypothetical protein
MMGGPAERGAAQVQCTTGCGVGHRHRGSNPNSNSKHARKGKCDEDSDSGTRASELPRRQEHTNKAG